MSPEKDDDRYEGKPLLKLLECYVLLCINQLSEDLIEKMNQITPYLYDTYNRQGSWDEIIAAEMEFPETMPERIHEMWVKNQKIAQDNNVELSPIEFAQMFVDKNFDIK